MLMVRCLPSGGMESLAWIPTAPPTLAALLAPTLQPVPVIPVIAVLLAVAYVTGWVRLRLQRRPWPVWRGVLFLTGCGLLAVTMGAGIEGYGFVLFSAFMFQQLTLMMTVPLLLVLGAPGTLLLRATPHRGPGRLVLQTAVFGLRSRLGRFLLHPGFMIPLFLITFYGLYLTSAADALLQTWAGHVGLELAFLAAGVLFTAPLIPTDPLPRRQGHLGRLLDAFLEMPLHAFFGVILMMATVPLVPAFTNIPASWGITAVGDQAFAGGLAWSYGEAPSLALVLILMTSWFRHESRKSRERDREIDRDGDPDLEAYNAHLARLQGRTTSPHEQHG